MRWLRLLRSAGSAAIEDDMLNWAATLAFYFLFALFPTVLLAASLLSAFHAQGLVNNLVVALTRNLPTHAADLVATQLNGLLIHHVPGLVSIDVIILVYAASQGFTALMAALNAAYEARETRGYLKRVGLALLLTVSAGMLLAIALGILISGQQLLTILTGHIHLGFAGSLLWPAIRWAITLAFMILALLLLYRFAPDGVHTSVGTLPAVLIALAVWIIASAVLSAYINNFGNYSAVYGSLGAVIGLMLWFYVLGISVLFGAEVHSAWLKDHGIRLLS
ncbi:MAG: YihY/virulence factor BrkB family protein [Terriglobales bacterium]